MNIKELLASINVIDVVNESYGEIAGIAYHSGKVIKGDLFFCIKGYEVDGHKYLASAKENGAVAAIVEDIQPGVDIPQFRVDDSRIAMATIAHMFYNKPSEKLNAIAITATNGKTSTSFMVNSILENQGLKTGLIGTVVVKIDQDSQAAVLTTPESIDLHSYYSEMVEAGCSHVTMEVSSSALELHRTGGSDFDIVALNNISREHIDSHGSFERYFEVKSSLITQAKKDSWAVLNLDCKYSKSLIDKAGGRVLTYGIEDTSGDLTIRGLDLSTGRGKFSVVLNKSINNGSETIQPCTFDVSLSVPGYHSVYNSLSAIAIALLSGISIETIKAGLKAFKGVERRFEFIYETPFIIVDDHFANRGNIKVTLETLNFMAYNKLRMIYAIRGSRGVAVNGENAEEIAAWFLKLNVDEIIVSMSRSNVNKYNKVRDAELEVFDQVMKDHSIEVRYHDELTDAIHDGLSKVEAGDVLLLAGCQGMDDGGHIALNQIHKMHPELNKEDLYAPIKYRVCGLNIEDL